MKLKKVYIENVLSYEKETIEFNDTLNLFVGANGAGKSNLMNIIIYILKRFCFKNYEISKNGGMDRTGYFKYSIREKNPLYNASENFFLKKHKLLSNKKSSIIFTIKFEQNDLDNLYEIIKFKDDIINFLDYKIDSLDFIDDRFVIPKENVIPFFEIQESDLKIEKEVEIEIIEDKDMWKIKEGLDEKYYCFMKYFSLMYNILNLIGIDHNIKNPFIFFEAYRNNAKETTMVSLNDYNGGNIVNTQSYLNMSYVMNSIENNSTYIMLATKKYGEIHRKCIEEENGKKIFENNKEYRKLKDFFREFNYEISINCIDLNNNVYQFNIIKDGVLVEIDSVSSGEREIINFICGLYLENMKDGIVVIDEPELHLHPSWQKKIIDKFREITKIQNIQMIFVTHSASFISMDSLNNVYRIYKDNGFSKCLKIEKLLDDEKTRKYLVVVNETNNSKIFFSNYVILVEGIEDEILFKTIYINEIGKIPEGVEFVNINGKKNLEKFKKVLDALKIVYFYIGDLDNLYDEPKFKNIFINDSKKQKKDLKCKEKSYDCLNLLKAIDNYLNDRSNVNYDDLKNNYYKYKEKYVKFKDDITKEEREKINNYIDNLYNENKYILKNGELEDYLEVGKSQKQNGFDKVIKLASNNNEYLKFTKTKCFNELKNIVEQINKKI